MKDLLSKNVSRWVFVAGLIIALLIPAAILLTRPIEVSETTSLTIHNVLHNEPPVPFAPFCQMDVVHEIAMEDFWRSGGFWIPRNEVRFLKLTYYLSSDVPIKEIQFLPEESLTFEIMDASFSNVSVEILEFDMSVMVPYMPSGGDIGVVYLDMEYDKFIEKYDETGTIITIVALFSAPENQPWYVNNVKIILSNLLVKFDGDSIQGDFFPYMVVSIEHQVTSYFPISI